jgi:hypothetical protein
MSMTDSAPRRGLGYRIAIPSQVEELCQLYPERAEEFRARAKSRACVPLDEYRRLVAEARRPKMPAQPIELVRKVTQQSLEQLAVREKLEAARVYAERLRDERQAEQAQAQLIAQRQAAIDACWSRQLAEKEITRAWDPQGLYGPATLASELD